jgi:hypothetical protein
MKPSIKKAVSGKTMRVASTFTGAAACAVAFTPAAMAGTGHPAVHQPVLNRAVPHKVGRPDISLRGCTAGTSNWFHIAYNKQSDICFGFKGTFVFSPNARPAETSFCGGNNKGWISGFNTKTGQFYFTRFGHGNFYAHIPNTTASHPYLLSSVHISSWAGNSKCGFP